MRPTSRLAMSLVLALAFTQPVLAPVLAYEPDDLPWDDNDRIETPAALPDDGEAASDTDPSATIDLSDPEPDAANTATEPPAVNAPAPQNKPETKPQTAPAGLAEPKPAPAPAPLAADLDDTEKFVLPIRAYLESKSAPLRNFESEDRAALTAFYEGRQDAALWVTATGFNDEAKSLIAELAKADDWGLDHNDYQAPELASGRDIDAADLTAAEVRLSLVAMRYARDARGFRIDNPTEKLSSYLDRKPQLMPPAQLIAGLAAAPDKSAYLRGLHPKHPQFERLRQKLLALRNTTKKAEAEKIPERGPATKPGASHDHIAMIRRRLKIPAPTHKPDGTAADENYYDSALAAAVKRYKEQVGITPVTMTITNKLRKALNNQTGVTEELLLANMEQWRWMPEDLGTTHVTVNVPEFLVRVVKNGSILHEERVITGSNSTQTPIFSDNMRTVVFQPFWNVPDSIKIKELLPKLRAGYDPIGRQGLAIKRNGRNLRTWDVDWYATDIRNYHIYQPPGPRNVLGVVKFLFPNKHAVYLHDTPTKKLFDQNIRTFSHGCMRVRNPVRLAEVLLAEDKGWNATRVRQLASHGPDNNDVALDMPMPVHVTYFTAWVDDAGNVKTFPDVYGHQKRIALGLEGRWNEIAKHRDHLLPVRAVPVARGPWDPYAPYGQRRYGSAGYKKPQQTVGDLLQQVFGGF